MNLYVHIIVIPWEQTGSHPNYASIHYIKDQLQKTKRDVRTASWLVYKSTEKQFPGEFPVGGLICTMHRRMEENKSSDVNDDTQLAPDPDFSPQTPTSPFNADTSKEGLDSFIDTAIDISSIKFQMMSPLVDYSVSTIRYANRK